MMTSTLVLLAMLALTALVAQGEYTGHQYEFENLKHSDGGIDWVWRSEADSLKTLRLDTPGRKSVNLTLCATPETPGGNVTAYIANVRYSNDGPADMVSVTLDGEEVGSFETKPIWACGNHWNVFYDTGNVGSIFSMAEGEHQLTICAQTDEYGMEIDKINIKTANQMGGVELVCNAKFATDHASS